MSKLARCVSQGGLSRWHRPGYRSHQIARARERKPPAGARVHMVQHRLSVDGMACAGCELNVEQAIGGVSGVSEAEADHEHGVVEVSTTADVSERAIREAIVEAGYDVD